MQEADAFLGGPTFVPTQEIKKCPCYGRLRYQPIDNSRVAENGMSGTALSDEDMEYLRETISNAIFTLQSEYAHPARQPDPTEDDLTAIEGMEDAACELEIADPMLEAKIAKIDLSRTHQPEAAVLSTLPTRP